MQPTARRPWPSLQIRFEHSLDETSNTNVESEVDMKLRESLEKLGRNALNILKNMMKSFLSFVISPHSRSPLQKVLSLFKSLSMKVTICQYFLTISSFKCEVLVKKYICIHVKKEIFNSCTSPH